MLEGMVIIMVFLGSQVDTALCLMEDRFSTITVVAGIIETAGVITVVQHREDTVITGITVTDGLAMALVTTLGIMIIEGIINHLIRETHREQITRMLQITEATLPARVDLVFIGGI
jgi:hypothetical protein